MPAKRKAGPTKRENNSYAEMYSHTGYRVATTHAPQFGPNTIVQDNTWDLTRQMKIIPEPFKNPAGLNSVCGIKFIIPSFNTETWIPSECTLCLSFEVVKTDGTNLADPANAAQAGTVHARFAGWANAMLIDDTDVRKYMTFITDATELFDWYEEYDTITDATGKVRVGTTCANYAMDN